MKKLFLIGFKDVKLAFRDKAALIFMLLAPFALTVGLGFVTGRFSGSSSSSGISDIPVVIVNQDGGQLGDALVTAFQSQDLAGLVAPTLSDNPADARQQVDNNTFTAAILIPPGFTESIIPAQEQNPSGAVVQIELYTNPTTPTSAGVIKTILEEFISQVEVGRVGGEVAVTQLVSHGLIQVQEAAQVGAAMGASQANAAAGSTAITLDNVTSSGQEVKFDVLALLAPGMALMFLMFTVSNGGRSLLTERNQGTLPRLLVSPTTSVQVLGGKVVGIFLTGAAQMFILIGGTSLMFGVQWGDPLAVLALVLAAVFGAVGWGMIITALVKTPGQVSAIGAAVMLTFGILGGTFINTENMPEWFRILTKITPNAWGVDGFTTLALGGGLREILTPIIALLIMGAFLFTVAALLFNRRGMMQRQEATMKKIFAIAFKDTRERFTGFTEWLFFLILPIVFTLVLAGGTGGSSDNRVRLVVVDQANTPLSADLVTALENSAAVRPDPMTLAKAEDQFSQRRASVVLIIPAEFDLAHLQQGSLQLELRQQPNNMNALIAQRAIQAVTRRVSSAVDIANNSVAEAEKIRPFASDADRLAYFDAALTQAQTLMAEAPNRLKTTQGTTPDQIEYDPRANSSAGQMITWVFIPLIGLSELFAYERQKGTLRRILTTPTRKATYLFGTIFGQVVFALVQMCLLIGFGILVMKLNWGQNIPGLAVMLLAGALAAAAMGTMLGTFVKTPGQASGLSIMLGMVMALMGGCWYPLEMFPKIVQNIVKVLPTTWAMQGLLDLVLRGQGLIAILPEAGVLLGFAAVFFVIGIWRFKYE